MPDLDLARFEPPVAELLAEARARTEDQPRSVEGWERLAFVCHAHRLYECAAFAYRRAHDLAPKDFRYPYLLAQVIDAEGEDPDEALALYERAAQMAPEYAPVYFHIGQLHAREGRTAPALAALEKAAQLDPDAGAAHRSLGQVLLADGRADEALAHLQKASRLMPADRATFSALAQAYVRNGDRERGQAAADKARLLTGIQRVRDPVREPVERLGTSVGILLERAKARIESGRFDDAIQLLLDAKQVDPDNPDLGLLLGVALGRSGRLDDAIAEFERVAEMAPPGAALHLSWGTAYAAKGDPKRAIAHYEEALRINPAYWDAHFSLGNVLEQTGKTEEAKRHYRKVATANPQHPAARRLAQLEAQAP